MATLIVDLASATPPYEQIRAQIQALAASGGLHVGEQLPSVRALARELGVATGTVARAYRELERAGVVVTRGRRGTSVAGTPPPPDPELPRRLDRALEAVVDAGSALGMGPDEIADLVRLRARRR